jgi:hypothetical protein
MKRLLFLFLFLMALGGCAGAPLTKIQEDAPLPPEVSEAEEKFAVKEVDPNAAPPPAPEAPKTGGKKKKTKAKAKVPLVYPNRRPVKDPFWLHERHVFDINYFGVTAGEFTTEVLPNKQINNRPVYHIKATARSLPFFSNFYRIDDYVESFWDYEGLFSHRFHLVQDESKQTRDALELYDQDKQQTFYWNRWNHKDRGYQESKDLQPMTPFSQDSLTALFYLRVLPLPDGAVITFPVISEGKNWEAQVTVVRREEINTPMGRYKAVVVKPETKFGGVLQKRGDSFLWFSDDERRYMLRMEAQVKIGTVIAACKRIEDGEPRTSASPEPGALTPSQ